MMSNPHGGHPYPDTPATPPRRTGAVIAFYVYCVLMALLYLLMLVGGLFVLFYAAEIALEDPNTTIAQAQFIGGMLTVMGLVFSLLFLIPPLLPRAKWAWIVGIIAIALGLTSCCTWPFTIPLMIFYVQEPTRRWYGMGAT